MEENEELATIPKMSNLNIILFFLRATVFNLILLCVDAFLVWLVWASILVKKFNTPALSVFEVLFILFGISAISSVIKRSFK